MNSIQEFNSLLNKSTMKQSKQKINYKEQVMRICSNLLSELENKNSMCVIGAGRMSDIDITFFVPFFKKIVLTDIDTESIYTEINSNKKLEFQKRKLEVIRTEYTGFELNHFFELLKPNIIKADSFEKIEIELQKLLKGLDEYKFLKDYDDTFDFMFLSPIYTQLIYNQVLRECSVLRELGYQEHLIKFIEDYMLDEMIQVIDRFNRNIVRVLNSEGRLMVLSDIFEVESGSTFYKRIEHSIHNYDVMEEIYESYKNTYGMGLGDYGLYNLDEKLDTKLSKWLIWPYAEKKNFVVKLKILKKKT